MNLLIEPEAEFKLRYNVNEHHKSIGKAGAWTCDKLTKPRVQSK